MTDYKTMYECAVDFARSLVREVNEKGEKILRLEAELRELKAQAEELRFNPYHDPKNGRFTSSNGGGGGVLYVGKGQAGGGTYIIEDEFDDAEYSKWLNDKIQSARAGRLQALIQNGRKEVEENPDRGKSKKDGPTQSIAHAHKNLPKEENPDRVKSKKDGPTKSVAHAHKNLPKHEIPEETKEKWRKLSLEVHRSEYARLKAEEGDILQLFRDGRISSGEFYGWKWKYNAILKKLKELEKEEKAKATGDNIQTREKENESVFEGKIIAVDFDGTIARTAYPKILSPIYETIDFLWEAKLGGAIIILWTCREGEELKHAVEWCEKTGVPIDYVNENEPQRTVLYGSDCRKISADIYIDDKAVGILDIAEYKNMEELRFNPYHDPTNGRFTSGKSLDKSAGSGIIKLKDDFIGHSLGAKAKNYEVMDLKTGEKFRFVEGTKIQNVEVFAGKGSKITYRRAYKFAEKYGGKESDWQHCKGNGVLNCNGEERKAEVHWSQCEGIGKRDFFVKEWLD